MIYGYIQRYTIQKLLDIEDISDENEFITLRNNIFNQATNDLLKALALDFLYLLAQLMVLILNETNTDTPIQKLTQLAHQVIKQIQENYSSFNIHKKNRLIQPQTKTPT